MKSVRGAVLGMIGILMLMGCSRTYVYEKFREPAFDPTSLSNRSMIMFGPTQINLTEFKKTYYNTYESDSAFVDDILHRLKQSVFSNQLTDNCRVHEPFDGSFLNTQTFDIEKVQNVNQIFSNIDEDFILSISEIDLGNEIEYTHSSNPQGIPQTSSTENCVVRLQIQIWDKSKKTKVLEFESYGKEPVSFFMFETAMNHAMDQAVDHATHYLKSGKIQF